MTNQTLDINDLSALDDYSNFEMNVRNKDGEVVAITYGGLVIISGTCYVAITSVKFFNGKDKIPEEYFLCAEVSLVDGSTKISTPGFSLPEDEKAWFSQYCRSIVDQFLGEKAEGAI